MDPQTSSPAAPGTSAATFNNSIIDKAEKNEFSNSARDMYKSTVNYYFNFTKEGENMVLESSDVIDFVRNIAPPFLAEVRKNDQARSTVGETTGNDSSGPVPQDITTDHTSHSSILENPVDVIDIVSPEPSSMLVTSIAERYIRTMLKCLLGYPLYDPKPFGRLSNEYPHDGINIGDVGFVRGSGAFDVLFNICSSQNGSINPPNLPDGFSLETPDQSETTRLEPLPPNTRLFQSPVTKTKSGEYICEGSEGAVLELPKGAFQDEATNIRPFEKLAARHGVQWYEYTMNRGRSISNGSLYLITSVTKCDQWGIAVFDRPCGPGQGLKFDKQRSLPFGKSTSKYRWKGSDTFPTKVSNPDQGDAANQCVFVRGYKIMIRQDIFDNLSDDQPRQSNSAIPSSSPQEGGSSMTRQRATRIRGGGGPDPVSRLTNVGLFSRTTATKSDDEVVLHPNFNSFLVHPSDFINAALLNQNPGAKVALIHDDVWCNLLQHNFKKLNHATLINIARSYTNVIEYGCISLERISEPSNVLEESGDPLKASETSAFEGPLKALPGDDPVPATISITLPHELVERILLLLDAKSMLKCRLVNREFNEIIQSSTLVQYYLACKAAGVIDNPESPLSCAERLEALKKREDAWRKLEPVFDTTIKVDDQPSEIVYQLTAGYYFFSTQNWKDVYYCHLPSSLQDKPEWSVIPGHGPVQSWSGFINDMGTAIYEHDLVVNAIFSGVGNQAGMQRYSLDLILLKLSTGEYHPLARHPLIHIQRSSSAQAYTVVQIVGDNLALVVYDQAGSKLLIFDWKTGYKRLEHKASDNAYNDSIPVFVSAELLLVPNRILSHFEVWHLFPSDPNSQPPVQVLSLKIPAVSVNYSITSMYCHGELSPFLHSMPYFPPRPFFSSSEDSIIVVSLLLESTGPQNTCKLVMYRRALLDMIKKWTSPSLLEQQERLQTWSMNEVSVHKVTDPDDGSVRLGVQSKLVSTLLDPESSSRTSDSPTLATSQISSTSTSHIPADTSSSSISSASSTSRYHFLDVQWADWGPPISRWLQFNATNTPGFCESAGQRLVFLDRNTRDKSKCMVGVADFNVHNARRNAQLTAQRRREGKNNGGNGNNGEEIKEENEELEILDHEGVFSEEVYMGLKCVVYYLPGEHDFDEVLMDEERLLGFKLDGKGRMESIKVLYVG